MPYIEMPKLSDTMTEGTVVKWHKAVGDSVNSGDILAEIETDKAVMDLEAFDEGVVKEIYVKEGGKARVGQELALLLAPGEAVSQSVRKAGNEPRAKPHTESLPRMTSHPTGAEPPQPVAPMPGGRVKASPLAKKIARAQGLSLMSVRGSGPGGRIIARDLESARSSASSTPPEIRPSTSGPGDRRIPLSGLRAILAQRLVASKTQIPHFYLHIEVDVGELIRLRAQLNEHLEQSGQGKLTLNDFVLKATAIAATKVPRVNASFDGDAVIEYADVHLSVAVAVEDGLLTPVVRQAQTKSLREISEAVKDLASRARSKKLKPAEYQGGTITVSNLGHQGIERFSAVINPPQAIILAIGAVRKKPVVNERDEIVVAHRMAIGLSADHRVVDGVLGAQFLAELRRLIEKPVGLLL